MAETEKQETGTLSGPRKKFRTRIILPTVLVLAALVFVMNIFLTTRFLAYGNRLVDFKVNADTNSLKSHLEEAKRNSRVAALSMAQNPYAVKAIKNRNRREITQIFAATYDLYNVNFFTITDKKGIVLARTQEPEEFGDSALEQQNVRDALRGKVSSYFEEGTTVKVSVRTGAPVYDGDELIGVVSAGVRFDTNEEVDGMKRLFGSEFTIFLGDVRVATTITRPDGGRIVGTKMDPGVAKIVLGTKKEYSGELEIHGQEYKVFYMPLLDADEKAFAVCFLGISKSELEAESKNSIRYGIIIGFVGLALSIALMVYIISSISAPIITLANDMENVANGHLDVAIDVKSQDEIGVLGSSLKKVVGTVHELIDGLVAMISEHHKGNTDFRIGTDAFHGSYKTLADHIMELADFSMKDQLTGLLNRRSFNNRLLLEWHRAIREKTSISLLVIDVDKFKHYNDEYGHQQGDEALRTVAKILKHMIKRSIDLAARWGGEEFVVLLPGTDSSGALRVAENIRSAIEETAIPCAKELATKITVSIGINTLVPQKDSSMDEFISDADGLLYLAKESGRNKVIYELGKG